MPDYADVIQDYLSGEDYTIVAGDTFSLLAQRWGMTTAGFSSYDAGTGVSNLSRLASGNVNSIQVGEVVKVPKLPNTVGAAPASITLPGDIAATMKELWEKSIAIRNKTVRLGPNANGDHNTIKIDRVALEHGGTFSWKIADVKPIIDRTGAGTAGTFSPNTSTAEGRYIIGDYHSHPYTRFTDGVHDIPNVSFSGGDCSVTVGWSVFFDAMQSHTTIFGLMRTKQTPRDPGNNAEDVYEEEMRRHLTDGKPETFRVAIRNAVIRTCNVFHLAYYEAFDSRTLDKVN